MQTLSYWKSKKNDVRERVKYHWIGLRWHEFETIASESADQDQTAQMNP